MRRLMIVFTFMFKGQQRLSIWLRCHYYIMSLV